MQKTLAGWQSRLNQWTDVMGGKMFGLCQPSLVGLCRPHCVLVLKDLEACVSKMRMRGKCAWHHWELCPSPGVHAGAVCRFCLRSTRAEQQLRVWGNEVVAPETPSGELFWDLMCTSHFIVGHSRQMAL